MRLLGKLDNLLALVFFPALVLHEYSHAAAFAGFGYDYTVTWNDLSVNASRSTVHIAGRPSLREAVLASALAPFALLVPAVLTILGIQVVYAPGVPWREAVALLLGVQGVGLVLQSGPSESDLDQVLAHVESSAVAWTVRSLNGVVMVALIWGYVTFTLGIVTA